MRKRKMKKKSQLLQVVFIAITIVSIAFTLIIGRLILTKFNTALEEGGVQTDESRDALAKFNGVWLIFDGGMVFILVGLTLGLIITSIFIPTHPIFIVVNIIGIFFLVWFGAIMSNMYGDMITSDPEISASANDGTFDRVNFIVNQLPYICAILITISTIFMFAKGKQDYGP